MSTVRSEASDGVCLVTLNRPEALNAFSLMLMDDLTEALLTADADDNVKVIVITGAGRAFSAGADLMEMGTRQAKPKHGLAGLLTILIDTNKPLLLAVNGLGVGIGATLCGLADIVIMADTARLRCPFSALGLTAEAASTYTLPRLLGRQRASWFLLASEWMDAAACREAGLALEVVPQEEVLETTLTKARTLAALPLASLETTKRLIMDPLRPQLHASVAAENAGLADLAGGRANVEAVSAFREKREPVFTGM